MAHLSTPTLKLMEISCSKIFLNSHPKGYDANFEHFMLNTASIKSILPIKEPGLTETKDPML